MRRCRRRCVAPAAGRTPENRAHIAAISRGQRTNRDAPRIAVAAASRARRRRASAMELATTRATAAAVTRAKLRTMAAPLFETEKDRISLSWISEHDKNKSEHNGIIDHMSRLVQFPRRGDSSQNEERHHGWAILQAGLYDQLRSSPTTHHSTPQLAPIHPGVLGDGIMMACLRPSEISTTPLQNRRGMVLRGPGAERGLANPLEIDDPQIGGPVACFPSWLKREAISQQRIAVSHGGSLPSYCRPGQIEIHLQPVGGAAPVPRRNAASAAANA